MIAFSISLATDAYGSGGLIDVACTENAFSGLTLTESSPPYGGIWDGCLQPKSATCTATAARVQDYLWHILFFSEKQNLSFLTIIFHDKCCSVISVCPQIPS